MACQWGQLVYRETRNSQLLGLFMWQTKRFLCGSHYNPSLNIRISFSEIPHWNLSSPSFLFFCLAIAAWFIENNVHFSIVLLSFRKKSTLLLIAWFPSCSSMDGVAIYRSREVRPLPRYVGSLFCHLIQEDCECKRWDGGSWLNGSFTGVGNFWRVWILGHTSPSFVSMGLKKYLSCQHVDNLMYL